jgi:cyclic pyranopterin phosphate synthase
MTITTLGVPSMPRRVDQSATRRQPAGPLTDSFGRVATDLRVSLTDRCNLRCTYCMPAEGLQWSPGEQLPRPDEIVRLVRIGVTRLGITKVRFTGGEPLLAKHLHTVIAATAALRPRPELALTTNGVLLAKHARDLARAGLNRVNV